MKILLWGVLIFDFKFKVIVLVIFELIIIEGIICNGLVVVNGMVFLVINDNFMI